MIRFVLYTIIVLSFALAFIDKTSPIETSNIVDIDHFKVARALRKSIKEKLDRPRPISHIVAKGETLAAILPKYGGDKSDALSIDSSLREIDRSLAILRVGDSISITRVKGELTEIKRNLPDGRVVTVDIKNDHLVSVVEPKVEVVERLITGSIVTTLADAAERASLSFDVVDQLVDIFSDRVNFTRDIQPGDTFSVIVTEKRIQGVGSVVDSIDAALLSVNGSLYGAVRHIGKDGKARYYNERGETQGGQFLRYPVQFTRITSVFNKARFHPILKRTRIHPAVDFAAPNGTTVRTVAQGVVEKAGWAGSAGNMVQIRHDSRYTTVYRHLSKVSVKKGQKVGKGDTIGRVGSTGLSTGPHLCFSVFKNGKYVDPLGKEVPKILEGDEKLSPKVVEVALERLRTHRNMMVLAQSELGGLRG